MKKWAGLVLMAVFIFGALPVFADTDSAQGNAYAYGQEDSILDKVSDWVATIGKSGSDKEEVLAERRLDRAMKRTSQAFKKSSKKASKAMKEFGKDMEKAFK